MIQTEKQYQFLYTTINYFIESLSRPQLKLLTQQQQKNKKSHSTATSTMNVNSCASTSPKHASSMYQFMWDPKRTGFLVYLYKFF